MINPKKKTKVGKETMDQPQEEFIEISSIPSHSEKSKVCPPKESPSLPETDTRK